MIILKLSSGKSSWLQIQRPGIDSRRYQIFWEVVGLERGPLSLVSTTAELLEWTSRSSVQENREYGRRGSVTLTTRHPPIGKQLALTLPTSGGRTVGIVRSRTQVSYGLDSSGSRQRPVAGSSGHSWVTAQLVTSTELVSWAAELLQDKDWYRMIKFPYVETKRQRFVSMFWQESWVITFCPSRETHTYIHTSYKITKAKTTSLFREIKACSPLKTKRRFGRSCRLHLQCWKLCFGRGMEQVVR
jgi:hypothetical protein